MVGAGVAYSLINYLNDCSADSIWVFQKTLAINCTEKLLGHKSVAGLLTYQSDELNSYQEDYRIGFLSNNPSKISLPHGRARKLVFNEVPRLDFLASAGLHLAVRGVFSFVWISPTGSVSYSFLRLFRLYFSFRLSNSLMKRVLDITRSHTSEPLPYFDDVLQKNPLPPRSVPKVLDNRIFLVIGCLGRGGGAERQLVNTAVGLAQTVPVRIKVLCTDITSSSERTALASDLIPKGIQFREPSHSLITLSENIQARLSYLLKATLDDPDLANDICRLTYEFWRFRPRIVHAWMDHTNIAAGLAAVISEVPTIILGCRNVAPTQVGLNRSFMQPLYRLLSRQNNVVFTNNSHAGAADYQRWLELPTLPTFVIYNGINITRTRGSKSNKNELRKIFNIPIEDSPIIGSVARFVDQKRPFLWIRVAKLISVRRPDCRFLMVGNGPLFERSRQLAKKLGLSGKIVFPGLVDDTRQAYDLIDCFLMTSRHEGLPNALLEAQAFGIPVVTSRAGGAGEAVLDGITGSIVDDPQPDNFANAVNKIIDDPSYLARAREKGPFFIENNFGLARMINNTHALYNTKFIAS